MMEAGSVSNQKNVTYPHAAPCEPGLFVLSKRFQRRTACKSQMLPPMDSLKDVPIVMQTLSSMTSGDQGVHKEKFGSLEAQTLDE